MSDNDLLTPADLGRKLGGADERRVMDWHRRYRWPHVKIGRAVFWTPEQADEIVRRHTVVTTDTEAPDLRLATGRTARSRARRKAGR